MQKTANSRASKQLFSPKSDLKISPTLAINQESRKLEEAGRTVFKFGFGQSPFPVPDLLQAELRNYVHEKSYLPVAGLPELRSVIAKNYSMRSQNTYTAEQVLIGPGTKMLLFVLQTALQGEVLIPAPSWVSYAPQAVICGNKITPLPTSYATRWQINPVDLIKACENKASNKPQMMILNSPANPSGVIYEAIVLKEIASIARKYGLIIIADEIYSELPIGSHRVPLLADYYPEGTIISNGLSKCWGAGGWRIGSFIFPPELESLQNFAEAIASETYSCVNSPAQYAAVRAYSDNSELKKYNENCRRVLTRVAHFSHAVLSEAGLSVIQTEGGFYIFPDFEPYRKELRKLSIETSDDLSIYLLKHLGFAALPGTAFGLEPERLCLRISYLDLDGKAAINGLDDAATDREYIYSYCPKVHEGLSRLRDWVISL